MMETVSELVCLTLSVLAIAACIDAWLLWRETRWLVLATLQIPMIVYWTARLLCVIC